MQKVRDLESQIEVLKTEKQKSPDEKWKFHFLSLKSLNFVVSILEFLKKVLNVTTKQDR